MTASTILDTDPLGPVVPGGRPLSAILTDPDPVLVARALRRVDEAPELSPGRAARVAAIMRGGGRR